MSSLCFAIKDRVIRMVSRVIRDTCLDPKIYAPTNPSQSLISLPKSQMSCQGATGREGEDSMGNSRAPQRAPLKACGSHFLLGAVSDCLCQFYCVILLRNSPHNLQKGVQRWQTGHQRQVWPLWPLWPLAFGRGVGIGGLSDHLGHELPGRKCAPRYLLMPWKEEVNLGVRTVRHSSTVLFHKHH